MPGIVADEVKGMFSLSTGDYYGSFTKILSLNLLPPMLATNEAAFKQS